MQIRGGDAVTNMAPRARWPRSVDFGVSQPTAFRFKRQLPAIQNPKKKLCHGSGCCSGLLGAAGEQGPCETLTTSPMPHVGLKLNQPIPACLLLSPFGYSGTCYSGDMWLASLFNKVANRVLHWLLGTAAGFVACALDWGRGATRRQALVQRRHAR